MGVRRLGRGAARADAAARARRPRPALSRADWGASTRSTSTGSRRSGFAGSARSCSRASPSSSSSWSATRTAGSPSSRAAATTGPTTSSRERPLAGREHGRARRLPALLPPCRLRTPGRVRPRRLTCRGHGEKLGRAAGGRRRAAESDEERRGFFGRLRESLGKSRRALTEQLQVAAFDPSDDASWERLEEALIYADVGVRATAELIRRLEARQDLTELSSGARRGDRRALRRAADARRRSTSRR